MTNYQKWMEKNEQINKNLVLLLPFFYNQHLIITMICVSDAVDNQWYYNYTCFWCSITILYSINVQYTARNSA